MRFQAVRTQEIALPLPNCLAMPKPTVFSASLLRVTRTAFQFNVIDVEEQFMITIVCLDMVSVCIVEISDYLSAYLAHHAIPYPHLFLDTARTTPSRIVVEIMVAITP